MLPAKADESKTNVTQRIEDLRKLFNSYHKREHRETQKLEEEEAAMGRQDARKQDFLAKTEFEDVEVKKRPAVSLVRKSSVHWKSKRKKGKREEKAMKKDENEALITLISPSFDENLPSQKVPGIDEGLNKHNKHSHLAEQNYDSKLRQEEMPIEEIVQQRDFRMAQKIMAEVRKSKILPKLLNSTETEIIQKLFQTELAHPSDKDVELLHGALNKLWEEVMCNLNKFNFEHEILVFLCEREKVKARLLDVLLLCPQNLPESWGGRQMCAFVEGSSIHQLIVSLHREDAPVIPSPVVQSTASQWTKQVKEIVDEKSKHPAPDTPEKQSDKEQATPDKKQQKQGKEVDAEPTSNIGTATPKVVEADLVVVDEDEIEARAAEVKKPKVRKAKSKIERKEKMDKAQADSPFEKSDDKHKKEKEAREDGKDLMKKPDVPVKENVDKQQKEKEEKEESKKKAERALPTSDYDNVEYSLEEFDSRFDISQEKRMVEQLKKEGKEPAVIEMLCQQNVTSPEKQEKAMVRRRASETSLKKDKDKSKKKLDDKGEEMGKDRVGDMIGVRRKGSKKATDETGIQIHDKEGSSKNSQRRDKKSEKEKEGKESGDGKRLKQLQEDGEKPEVSAKKKAGSKEKLEEVKENAEKGLKGVVPEIKEQASKKNEEKKIEEKGEEQEKGKQKIEDDKKNIEQKEVSRKGEDKKIASKKADKEEKADREHDEKKKIDLKEELRGDNEEKNVVKDNKENIGKSEKERGNKDSAKKDEEKGADEKKEDRKEEICKKEDDLKKTVKEELLKKEEDGRKGDEKLSKEKVDEEKKMEKVRRSDSKEKLGSGQIMKEKLVSEQAAKDHERRKRDKERAPKEKEPGGKKSEEEAHKKKDKKKKSHSQGTKEEHKEKKSGESKRTAAVDRKNGSSRHIYEQSAAKKSESKVNLAEGKLRKLASRAEPSSLKKLASDAQDVESKDKNVAARTKKSKNR